MNIEDWIESIIKKEVKNIGKERVEREQNISDLIQNFEKEKDSWTILDEKEICDEIDDLWDSVEEPIDEKEICDTIEMLHSEPVEYHYFDSHELLTLIKKLGMFPTESKSLNKKISTLINKFIIRKAKFLTDETIFQVEVQKQVIAIAINDFIDNPEETIGSILNLNPDLFYAICGPMSTVVLLDARRWVLETEFLSDDEKMIWYL